VAFALPAHAEQSLVDQLCNSSAFPAASGQRHLVCYAGSFLFAQLEKVKANETVSASHLRSRLLPYLGGPPVLEKLLTDTAQEPGCTVCYTDAAVKTELEAARTALGAERVAAYDKLPVCYTLLADRILEELPRNEDGIMVVVHPKLADEPLKHVEGMFRAMFMNHAYNKNSCRKKAVASSMMGGMRHGLPFMLGQRNMKFMGGKPGMNGHGPNGDMAMGASIKRWQDKASGKVHAGDEIHGGAPLSAAQKGKDYEEAAPAASAAATPEATAKESAPAAVAKEATPAAAAKEGALAAAAKEATPAAAAKEATPAAAAKEASPAADAATATPVAPKSPEE